MLLNFNAAFILSILTLILPISYTYSTLYSSTRLPALPLPPPKHEFLEIYKPYYQVTSSPQIPSIHLCRVRIKPNLQIIPIIPHLNRAPLGICSLIALPLTINTGQIRICRLANTHGQRRRRTRQPLPSEIGRFGTPGCIRGDGRLPDLPGALDDRSAGQAAEEIVAGVRSRRLNRATDSPLAARFTGILSRKVRYLSRIRI